MSRYPRWLRIVLVWVVLAGAALPPVHAQSPSDAIEFLLSTMTPTEKVGQLFVVSFSGIATGNDSDIARLIRDYRIGGVVLTKTYGNILPDAESPQQIGELTSALQSLALIPTAPPGGITGSVTTTIPIPLLIGLEQEGDGLPYTMLTRGFTALPSNMALGATWSPEYAEAVGAIVGGELAAVGVNLLLGPSLDVIDMPRPGLRGDLGTRAFGGDPFWTGRLGQAYVRGVHLGSQGLVATVVKHFPGQGSSDRRPDEEVATVQKSLDQLKQIELPPFIAVTEAAPGQPEQLSITDVMMSSHIRYRGFQGNVRQLTPPISLAPQLQDVLNLQEFVPWRTGGGLLMSDALGAAGVKRVYDPELQRFPARQIAQDAFLAGNDLLFLSQFALTDVWADQLANIEATLQFFREKYVSDRVFQAQVDASVRRILQLKFRLYPEFGVNLTPPEPGALEGVVGEGGATTTQIAKEAITLIYPGESELADRLPSAPLEDERIVIVTDTRAGQECAACLPQPYVETSAIADIILRLYGPQASGQIAPDHLQSLTFAQLKAFLSDELPNVGTPSRSDVERAIQQADWIVFAMLDVEPETHPDSDAVKQFLRLRSDSLRDKKLIVLALNAPYYLDTTEISKLTAYFGVFGKSTPFLEAAVRALFKEFNPRGDLPVAVPGISYDMFTITEPDPAQVIPLTLRLPDTGEGTTDPVAIDVGSTLQLVAGPVTDFNGHIVPNGTGVVFRFFYPAESLELPRQEAYSKDGYAETSITLQRQGELRVTVSSGAANQSTTLVVSIQPDRPATIATEVPTPTPTSAPTPTPTGLPPGMATPAPTSGPARTTAPLVPRRVDAQAFVTALGAALAVALTVFLAEAGAVSLAARLPLMLWIIIGGLIAYIVYGLGWLPGATSLQHEVGAWGAGIVSMLGALVPLGAFGVARLWARVSHADRPHHSGS